MRLSVGTKTRIDTKVAVALVAGAVVLAAGIAGGVGVFSKNRKFGATQGYGTPGYGATINTVSNEEINRQVDKWLDSKNVEDKSKDEKK